MTKPCGNCKLCPNMTTQSKITYRGIIKQCINGGTCKTSNVVYAARCKIHNTLYVGHTGDPLSSRFAKHRYDIKNRPNNSELAEHFHQNHSPTDLEVTILKAGLESHESRKRAEDIWMCKLQTISPAGLNKDCGGYVKEVYKMYSDVKN